MNTEKKNHFHTVWIERYLLGELEGEELTQFTHRFQLDQAFQQEVLLQSALVQQLEAVGQKSFRQELESLHRQLGFSRVHHPFRSIYAFAAAVTLLIATTLFCYFSFYSTAPSPLIQDAARLGLEEKRPVRQAFIPLQVRGKGPSMGFSGVYQKDSLVVLIYSPLAHWPTYQLDDTLRLYGAFTPAQLKLQYDQPKGQYTLQVDSLFYPLQRYYPRQALTPIP